MSTQRPNMFHPANWRITEWLQVAGIFAIAAYGAVQMTQAPAQSATDHASADVCEMPLDTSLAQANSTTSAKPACSLG